MEVGKEGWSIEGREGRGWEGRLGVGDRTGFLLRLVAWSIILALTVGAKKVIALSFVFPLHWIGTCFCRLLNRARGPLTLIPFPGRAFLVSLVLL